MFTQNAGVRLSGVLVALFVLMAGLLFAPLAHAQLITQAQVDEQKRTVLVQIVNTLEAHYKLIGMIFVQQLEARVAQLQAQVDAQTP